jgi:hypothetical protein
MFWIVIVIASFLLRMSCHGKVLLEMVLKPLFFNATAKVYLDFLFHSRFVVGCMGISRNFEEFSERRYMRDNPAIASFIVLSLTSRACTGDYA